MVVQSIQLSASAHGTSALLGAYIDLVSTNRFGDLVVGSLLRATTMSMFPGVSVHDLSGIYTIH